MVLQQTWVLRPIQGTEATGNFSATAHKTYRDTHGTALFIYLFGLRGLHVVFSRVLQPVFCLKRFLMLRSCNLSHLEPFFVMFSLSFSFTLAPGASARGIL